MKLKKLRLKNIRSYKEQEIVFPDGSVLLSGDVGSGKTTALLAIEYALFGIQPGQKGSALLRNLEAEGEVALELEIDGQNVLIERKLRRGSKNVSNEYSAITMNGEKTELAITELKTKILDLLGYPEEFLKKNNLLYRYTVYTPQENMKEIITEDPDVRLNVIRHIFGIDKYKRIRENLVIFLNYLKENSKFLQGEIKTLDDEKRRLDLTKESIKSLDSRINDKESQILENIKKRKAVESELSELEGNIKEKERLEKEAEKTQIMLNSKKDNLSSLEREMQEISRSIGEVKEVFTEEDYIKIMENIIDKKKIIESLNSKYIEIVGRISSLEQSRKENLGKKERVFSIEMCPTCLQNVPYAHKHNIFNAAEQELARIKNEYESLDSERKNSVVNIQKEKSELVSFEDRKLKLEILRQKTEYLNKSKFKLLELSKQKENLNKDLLLLSKHNESLKESILSLSKYHNLFRIKQEDVKNAFKEEKNSEIAAAELKRELELTHKEIANLSKLIENKEFSKKNLLENLELSSWLSNQFLSLVDFTERNVLIKIRIEFSRLFSKWFHMIAGDSFEVQLDENFTPLIMHQDTEMDYSFISGGERTAVALAYRLALNQTINSILSEIKTKDIVILDEPTDGFSEAQINRIRDVLRELNVNQLMIVSHEHKIEGFVDNVIKLKKESDVSSLEYNTGEVLVK